MRPRLLDILVCPIDNDSLELVVWESRNVQLSEKDKEKIRRRGLEESSFSVEIETGVLLNKRKKIFYPIYNGVPRMNTFAAGVNDTFLQIYNERIQQEMSQYSLPSEKGVPGEKDVLRTFSNEWVDYGWDGESYWNLSPDGIHRCMEYVLDVDKKPLKDKLVLEAGIGIGGISDHIVKKTECETVGIDLSYAVDSAYAHFKDNLFFHIVQASVYASPFRDRTFDFVFSMGVIHHTYSTKSAFDKLSRLPKSGGRFYVWVYSYFDEQRTIVRRILMVLENILRPICWRLPKHIQTFVLLPMIFLYIVHQNLFYYKRGSNRIKYGWRQALHAARDRFTPRYVHRHTDEEVAEWFVSAGYHELTYTSQRDRPEYAPVSFFTSTGVGGVRV